MFSVLLSVYRKENPLFLAQSLKSVFNQTITPSEVVLVKDGPLGNNLEHTIDDLLRQYPMIKIVSLAKNQGLGNALKEGLICCSFDIVARMDTDDIAKHDRFEKQIAVLKTFPEVDVVGAWIDEFENDYSSILSKRKLPETHDEICAFSKKRNPINHPVVMFRKKAVISAGNYQHFPLFEDYYLWVRMLANGSIFYNIQESLLYFRLSPESFKRRGGWKYALEELRFQNKLRSMKFISNKIFMLNVLTRFIIRIIPNKIRAFLYKKTLR